MAQSSQSIELMDSRKLHGLAGEYDENDEEVVDEDVKRVESDNRAQFTLCEVSPYEEREPWSESVSTVNSRQIHNKPFVTVGQTKVRLGKNLSR